MPGPGLPVNVDTTYADDGADATVKLHQQNHDALHALANEHDTATRGAGVVFVPNGTLFVPRALLSSDVPTTDFEVTAGGNYTFTLADRGKLKGSLTTDTSALSWTVPANATVAFPIGTTIKVLQRGTGQITLVTAAGVLFVGIGTRTANQGATMLCTKLFIDTWLLEGAVS